jgi:hypothetical protein
VARTTVVAPANTLTRKDRVVEFFESYTFMALMAVILLALIGVFFFLRNKRPED